VDAWKQELNDFIRAFAGAYIFGIPLLFTMEMWWLGEFVDQWKLLVFVGVAILANLGLTYVAGFKRESTFVTTVDEAIDAVAVGVVAATVMLLVLNQIRPGDPLEGIVGKIVVQAVPLSIGASVANQVFGTNGEKTRQGDAGNGKPTPQTLAGAFLRRRRHDDRRRLRRFLHRPDRGDSHAGVRAELQSSHGARWVLTAAQLWHCLCQRIR
jgi:putative integral membrane protein (TIGR02587 family)